LLLDLLLEWVGPARLHEWLSWEPVTEFQTGLRYLRLAKNYLLPALLVVAILYLLWHHYTESRKPGYEFGFLSQLNRFVRQRTDYRNEQTLIPMALKLFHRVFEGSHIDYCSVYVFSEGSLLIPDHYVYPRPTDNDYTITLKVGEGVAGRVYTDAMPRYMPRLKYPFATSRKFLPTFPFPHAIKFEPQLVGDGLELVDDDLDFFSFKDGVEKRHGYLSFVSVPLKAVDAKECFGVLNFDFSKIDALDKAGITMASIFGLVLADELQRLRAKQAVDVRGTEETHIPESRQNEAAPHRQPAKPTILNLGPGHSREGMDRPDIQLDLQTSETHLTWAKIRSGWVQFKAKVSNS
jgi:hypothetical protein